MQTDSATTDDWGNTNYSICAHHLFGDSLPKGRCSECMYDPESNRNCSFGYIEGWVYTDGEGRLRAKYISWINGAEAVVHLTSFWLPVKDGYKHIHIE